MSNNTARSDPPDSHDSDADAEADDHTLRQVIETLRDLVPSRGGNDESVEPVDDEDIALIKELVAPHGVKWADDHTQLGNIFSRSYYISNWPKKAQSHLLYELLTDPRLVYDASFHYEPLPNNEAVERLADIQDKLEDKINGEFAEHLPNTEAHEQTLEQVRKTKVKVENDGQRLYEISIYLTVYTNNEDMLGKIDRMVQRDIRESGGKFTLAAARKYPDKAHVSSSPIGRNELRGVRNRASQLLLDRAAATTFPLANDSLLEESGIVIGYNLADGGPIAIDLFERNNGYNVLVIGDLGSGKSASEKQYLLRHRHTHPDDNIIIIDPMEEFHGVNDAIGGEHVRVDGSRTINPLEIKETPQEILEAGEQIDPLRTKLNEVRIFFRRYFETYLDETVANELWAPLMRAVNDAYEDNGITDDPATHGNPSPTMTDVLDNIADIANNPADYASSNSEKEVENWESRASDLLMLFEPFREGNELDNLAGQTDLDISTDRPTYIDLGAYEGGDGTAGLMMKIVFSMVYEQIKETDGRSIIAIDEAHKFIDGDEADAWEERFRHSRHHDLSIHLISQRFDDFFQDDSGEGANEAAKAMAGLCTVQRVHRVNDVERPLAREALGLSDDHINFIEGAVPGEDDTKNYTTALLRVADKGTFGLKVQPTKTELDLIDFERDDLDDPETTVGNQRIEHNLKLKRDGLSSEQSVSDERLQELIETVPLHQMHADVIEQFIDRLISEPETEYGPDDRDLLEELLLHRESTVDEFAPELTSAVEMATANLQPPEKDNTGADSQPRSPPQPGNSRLKQTEEQHSASGKGPATTEQASADGGPHEQPPSANGGQSRRGRERSEQTPDESQPATPPTSASRADEETADHSQNGQPPSNEAGSPDGAPRPPSRATDSAHNGGPDEENHITQGEDNDGEMGGNKGEDEDESADTTGVAETGLPSSVAQLDVHVAVDDPIAKEKRVQVHVRTLKSLPDQVLSTLIQSITDAFDEPTSEAAVTEVAAAFAETEIEAGGDSADIQSSHFIKSHYPAQPTQQRS